MNTNGIYHEVNRIYHVYEKYHMNVGYIKIMRFDFERVTPKNFHRYIRIN